MFEWTTAAALIVSVVALLHSVLGERYLIGPLIRDMPRGPLSLPFARRTARAAWHLTTLALWALAAGLVWPQATTSIFGATMLTAAVALGLWTRGAHFAWPLFAAAGTLAAVAHDARVLVVPAAWGLTAVLIAIAMLHVYWAAGGRWAIEGAVPFLDRKPRFVPGRLATIAVAVALGGLAVAVLAAAEVVALPVSSSLAKTLVALGGAAFVLRAIGEGRYVGFFKRRGGTLFARRDTAIYTPLCVFLGFASFAVVL
ncbi:MAG: DUF3995 domain-containing protein [Deltaproteobacteria bacterium]